jgi:hypothetical protein
MGSFTNGRKGEAATGRWVIDVSKGTLLIVVPDPSCERHPNGPRLCSEERGRTRSASNRSGRDDVCRRDGAALDLTPAAKVALTIKVAAAIQAAVAEERQKLACVR